MITFFTHLRPMDDEFGPLQHMAQQSWLSAVPGCEVLTYGPDGDMTVKDLFESGERDAQHDWLCEISSDIVLSANIETVLKEVGEIERPFVIGQRWDIDPGAAPDTATLHPPSAVDYFLYRKGTLGEVPPFNIGRTVYDQWLVWAALERWNMTVIDATRRITAVHVNHGYPKYGSREKMRQSAERKENIRLARESGCNYYAETRNAPYVLNGNGVTRR